MNTVNAKSLISKFTSNGSVLLKKRQSVRLIKPIRNRYIVPENAVSYDFVRVGRNFSPKNTYTDVFTFRDKNGQLVKRYINQVDGTNTKETVKWYEKFIPWERYINSSDDEVLQISGNRVRFYTRENGKISSVTEDFYSVTKEKKPILSHFRKTIKPILNDGIFNKSNYENILLEQRRNGEKAKYIRNEYLTDKFKVGYFNLLKSDSSSPELAKIAKNTYFLPYVSSKNKFAYRMADACIQDANFICEGPEVVLYKQASTQCGFFSNSGKVNINLKSSRDLAMPREALTETIGHEVGHAKWDEKTLLYDLYKEGFDDGDFLRNIDKSEIPDIEKYKYSVEHYVPFSVNKKAYYNQFCEKVAQQSGENAVKKYEDFEESLKEQFSNMHGFQFYKPAQKEDELQRLFAMISALK